MRALVIIFITYARTEYALETIKFVCDNLKYAGLISWYVCDDGSPQEHYTAVLNYLNERNQDVCGHHSERLGYGAGVNKAWLAASQVSDVTLWIEDDWRIKQPFDISPHVELVGDDPSVGMMRLGYLQQFVVSKTIPHNGYMYLDLELSQYFAFAGHPHLKHTDFMKYYGTYPEGWDPGATELKYEEKVRGIAAKRGGPRIFWHMPCHWGHFDHFGAVDSYG